MYNFVGTSFGDDDGLDMCSEKCQSREGVFFVGRRSIKRKLGLDCV